MIFNSVAEITNKIIEIEKSKNLFEWSLKDIKIYEIIRYKIYIAALDAYLGIKNSTSSKSKSKFTKLIERSPQIKNFLFYNPLNDKSKSDYLLFESSRKQLVDGEFIDPFTYSVKETLLKDKKNFTIYQSSYFYDKLAKKEKGTKHLDRIHLAADFKSKRHKISFDDVEITQISSIGNYINELLDVKINFLSLVKSEIASFRLLSGYFSRLLDNKKPERIYIVNFCDKSALISECKKRKIEVIDIQHGLISNKDIIYHYPDVKEGSLKYFPDKFYAWSDLWLGNCILPLSKPNIIFVENQILLSQVEKYKGVKKEEENVLILSQDTLTVQILKSIKSIILNNSGKNFYFKAHPNEYSYIESLPEFKELAVKENFSLIPQTADLYKFFAECKTIIGVYSSALIEAIYFGCNVFILSLPGSEMMDFLLASSKVKNIKDFEFAKFADSDY